LWTVINALPTNAAACGLGFSFSINIPDVGSAIDGLVSLVWRTERYDFLQVPPEPAAAHVTPMVEALAAKLLTTFSKQPPVL
jgi:hypothetical protein